MAKSYKVSVPFSLDKKHIDFIERTGVGKNFSDKARNIFDRAIECFDVIAEYDGIAAHALTKEALLIYEQTEGERHWANEPPFAFNKKDGWEKLMKCAEKNKFICQAITNEETGYVAVFISPPKSQLDCKACQARIVEAINSYV